MGGPRLARVARGRGHPTAPATMYGASSMNETATTRRATCSAWLESILFPVKRQTMTRAAAASMTQSRR